MKVQYIGEVPTIIREIEGAILPWAVFEVSEKYGKDLTTGTYRRVYITTDAEVSAGTKEDAFEEMTKKELVAFLASKGVTTEEKELLKSTHPVLVAQCKEVVATLALPEDEKDDTELETEDVAPTSPVVPTPEGHQELDAQGNPIVHTSEDEKEDELITE